MNKLKRIGVSFLSTVVLFAVVAVAIVLIALTCKLIAAYGAVAAFVVVFCLFWWLIHAEWGNK